jgi:hypothetical protein
MDQQSLFHEDVWQALTDCIRALGGAKKVGCMMRPVMGPEKAGRWLLDCVNPAREEKLDIEQILFILTEARNVGCHAGITYINRVTGYADPQPIEPEDEIAALERQFIEANREQATRSKRIEELFARQQRRRT